MSDLIITETDGPIFVVKLNRPEKHNALNTQIRQELVEALQSVHHSDDIRAIVIWGGTEVFAAGADLEEMVTRTPMQAMRQLNNTPDMTETLASLRQPTIAAVSGLALGGGMELSMAADLRIASSTAQFGQSEINVGLIPGAGGTQRLSRYVGLTKAKEMVFLGERIDAHEAFRLGLVNKVVPPERLLDEAMSWARKLAAKPVSALRMAKLVMDRGYSADLPQALTMELLAFSAAFSTADQKEGARAFVERRPPNFVGEPT